MIGVASLDRFAATGSSWLHRASAPAKWLIVAATVALAVLARSPWPLAGGYVLLLAAAASCRLPLRTFGLASLLPLPAFGLIALSRWSGSPLEPLIVVGKGMNMVLAGLLVAATTPYPDLLAPATRVLPPVLADSLVLTYRAIFILLGRVESLWRTIRARGGFFDRPAPGALPWPARGTSWRRRGELAATGTALALLRGVDLSTRLYDVMRLRGYTGKLAPTRPLALGWHDAPPLLLSVALVALGVGARLTGV